MKFITKHKTESAFEAVKDLLETPQLALVEENGKIYCFNSKEVDATYLYLSAAGYSIAEVDGFVFQHMGTREVSEELSNYGVEPGLYHVWQLSDPAMQGDGKPYGLTKTAKISKVAFPFGDANLVLIGFDSMDIPSGVSTRDLYIKYVYGFAEMQEDTVVIDKSTGKNANGYEYVDLGLTSGTKWATLNVGATGGETPESWYGKYIAWGETEEKVWSGEDGTWIEGDPKYIFTNTKYQTAVPEEGQEDVEWNQTIWSKYHSEPNAEEIHGNGDNILDLELVDDAAHVQMGGDWHMPTLAQLQELDVETEHHWVENYNDVAGLNGTLFISKVNENTLFIPAAGCRYWSSLDFAGSYCYLWSSSLYFYSPSSAYSLWFHSEDFNSFDIDRYYGQSVRGVL